MFKHVFNAVAVASILAATTAPLTAQDNSVTLSAGEPIENATPANSTGVFTLETHGDWEIRCTPMARDLPDACSLYQLLQDDQGTGVSEVSMFYLGQGEAEAAANFIAPLGTLLTAQMPLFVDGTNGRRYPFTFCGPAGCYVRAGLTSAEIDQFKNGAVATITLRQVSAPEQPVKLAMSLTGFTAAYERIKELNIAASEAHAAAVAAAEKTE